MTQPVQPQEPKYDLKPQQIFDGLIKAYFPCDEYCRDRIFKTQDPKGHNYEQLMKTCIRNCLIDKYRSPAHCD